MWHHGEDAVAVHVVFYADAQQRAEADLGLSRLDSQESSSGSGEGIQQMGQRGHPGYT